VGRDWFCGGANTVFRALTSLFQLALPFAETAPAPPRTGDELLAGLRALGLKGAERVCLTRNRTVMVSYRGGALRAHRVFLDAPAPVLRALVTFVEGRTRAKRAAARSVLLEYSLPLLEHRAARRRPEARLPDDAPTEERFARHHAALNLERFGGALRTVPVRVSRRLQSRLGYYRLAVPGGAGVEIVISRRHLRRHGWDEAVATLLHEMVHQWQDESGLPVDHGPGFRAKARAVGVTPAARRAVR
jgi:SprT-like family